MSNERLDNYESSSPLLKWNTPNEIFTVTIVASFLLIFLFQGSIGDFSLSDNVTFNLISAATISTFYLFDIETKDLM